LTGALTKIVERRRSSNEGRKEGRKQQSKGGRKEGKDLMEEKTKSNMTLGLSLWGSHKPFCIGEGPAM